jgi:alpha-1,3-mannosyltransferase
MKVRNILGVQINDISKLELLELVSDSIQEKSKMNIAIVNAHTINLAKRDKSYLEIINSFFVINDGLGIELASRILYGKGFRDNLNGTDLIPFIFRNVNRKTNVYLFGAKQDVVDKCANNINMMYCNINICGYSNGYIDRKEEDILINKINSSRADILLVAKGNPLQEKWIFQNKENLSVPVSIGVGALFDFISGLTPRAPYTIRKIKMEWLYRLYLEPSRMWKRYLVGNFVFIIRVCKQKLRQS